MMQRSLWNGVFIMVEREIRRFMRVWPQTLAPPLITTTLYFMVFGTLIGERVGEMGGYPYATFMAPGLIMLSVIQNAYANVTSSTFGLKFMRVIEEMLVAPLPNAAILIGFVSGGVVRALITAVVVYCVALFFTDITVHSWSLTLLVAVLTSIVFSLMGLINALYAETFDDISIIPSFILTPLIYLGGVFFSVTLLGDPWRTLSLGNPILYMVNGFRYGMLGVSDVSVTLSLGMLVLFIAVFYAWAMWLLRSGQGTRS